MLQKTIMSEKDNQRFYEMLVSDVTEIGISIFDEESSLDELEEIRRELDNRMVDIYGYNAKRLLTEEQANDLCNLIDGALEMAEGAIRFFQNYGKIMRKID